MDFEFYHGTEEKNVIPILKEGFVKRSLTDSGDFGAGVYLSQSLSRAKSYGKWIFTVEIDLDKFAYIETPYFIKNLKLIMPKNEIEELFYYTAFDDHGEMKTCSQNYYGSRKKAAEEIRKVFLEKGFKGITTDYTGKETVVFDPSVIKIMNVKFHE